MILAANFCIHPTKFCSFSPKSFFQFVNTVAQEKQPLVISRAPLRRRGDKPSKDAPMVGYTALDFGGLTPGEPFFTAQGLDPTPVVREISSLGASTPIPRILLRQEIGGGATRALYQRMRGHYKAVSLSS